MISGGTQIQTITLQQSGGIPSNRISSVNNGGSFNYTYSYDNAGNVTNDGLHTYIYDAENRLVSVDSGATAQYTYDYKNRRTVKTVGTTITRYVWEDEKVIAEYDGSTGNLTTEYIYSGNRMIGRFAGGTTRYYLNDRLSERVVLDTNGAIVGRMGHLPYGEEIGTSGEQEKHRFTSYEKDNENNQDYAINRHYASTIGRFQQSDPYRASGGVNIPQSWNRYNYTLNNPVNFTDPTGLLLAGPEQPSENPTNPCPGATIILFGIPLICLGGAQGGSGGTTTPPPQCPVSPLTPLDANTQRYENGFIDVANLTTATQQALTCFQNAVRGLGGTFTLTSAYRPPSYQQHFREIWDKYQELQRPGTRISACAAVRTQVTGELQKHRLITRPDSVSDHTLGVGFDATISGVRNLAQVGRQCGLFRPYLPGDPVHWRLIGSR